MASKRKIRPAPKPSNGFDRDAWEAAAQRLARACSGNATALEAARSFIAETEPLVPDESEPATHETRQSGLSLRRRRPPEDHNAKRAPAGHEYHGGRLMEPIKIRVAPPSRRREAIARSIMLSLACGFVGRTSEGQTVQMYATIRRALAGARASGLPGDEKLEAMFRALFGHDYGDEWKRRLEQLLHDDARIREEQKLRTKRGQLPPGAFLFVGSKVEWVERKNGEELPGEFDERLTDAAMLSEARDAGAPPELNERVLAELRQRVNLGGGGRSGGKTARAVVDEFVRQIAPKQAKRRAKSARRNSRA